MLPNPEPLDAVADAQLCPFPKASESLSTSSRGRLDPWLLYARLPLVWLPLALTKQLRLEGVGAQGSISRDARAILGCNAKTDHQMAMLHRFRGCFCRM